MLLFGDIHTVMYRVQAVCYEDKEIWPPQHNSGGSTKIPGNQNTGGLRSARTWSQNTPFQAPVKTGEVERSFLVLKAAHTTALSRSEHICDQVA